MPEPYPQKEKRGPNDLCGKRRDESDKDRNHEHDGRAQAEKTEYLQKIVVEIVAYEQSFVIGMPSNEIQENADDCETCGR